MDPYNKLKLILIPMASDNFKPSLESMSIVDV